MELIKTFISEYGTQIIYTILTAIAGYIGVIVKRYINDKTKESVAKTVVKAVEQIYTDLHGDDKLNKAIESATGIFNEKGISVTELELRMLIESALAEFNKAFNKDTQPITVAADGITYFDNEDVPTKELEAIGFKIDDEPSETADE